jgi:glutamate-ammonia-ligase adenylyltransferase
MTDIGESLTCSRAMTRLLAARPELAEEITALQAIAPNRTALEARLHALAPTAETLKRDLRRFKQWASAWVSLRDLAGAAPLGEVTEVMTLIAELAVRQALATLGGVLEQRYGQPRGTSGAVQQLIVVGMGKLGGRELNVSSDIDLIFVYPEDGDTTGTDQSISNFEYFGRLGRQLINAIADVTEDGYVFRVDMRLRPNGDSGPLVCSLDMLENYLYTQGREWERYAWIKARPLTGERHEELEAIRNPFVFRRYLDFGAINAMRSLHAQIRAEVARKDMADNIKLGPGGIREIEFIAQVFQLIRGGRDRNLQVKPTLQVLARLAERAILAPEAERELATAYDFLRRLEHRLQYLDDAQTHALPAREEDQALIARAMGHADYAALLAVLDDHRSRVARHFEAVFADPTRDGHSLSELWLQAEGSDRLGAELARLGFAGAEEAAQRLMDLKQSARYMRMTDDIRERFDALMPRVIEASAATANATQTLHRVLDLLDSISRRAAYLALLQQYPQALQKVAELVSSSSWAAQYLQQHPILLDELLDPRLLDGAHDWPSFAQALDAELDALEPDTERQMDQLREAHHAQVFRLLTQDLTGELKLERLSDHLSELADIIVGMAVKFAWRKILTRHCEMPRFAVIGYGKLGGKELGYASDLDLVFVFDDPAPEAAQAYSRLATRLGTWLSAHTAAGHLFETDLRLRPNGDSGLVVVSLEAFRQYQLEAAWVWEHQALTRARFCAGDAAVGAGFEQIRTEVLRRPRDLAVLRKEVLDMRQRMMDAHATPAGERAQKFNLKHDPGGLIDVEFIVQYLVLGHAHAHPELCGNLGNIALLQMAADFGLVPTSQAECVRNAYREYRRLQHASRLNEGNSTVDPALVTEQITVVRALWQHVFNPSPST